MNYLSKLYVMLGALFLVFVSGCSLTELEDKLDNPNAVTPESAELSLVFNNAMLEFVEFVDEASDETMPYVRMVAMTGGDLYENADGPGNFDFIWSKAYSEVIPDLNLVIDRGEAEGLTTYSGAAKVLKAYVIMTLVDLFGDVPYSQAFQGVENPSPTADSGADVYAAAFALLESAITDLSAPKGDITDLYYGGSAAKWLTLANTLKLRYHVTTKLVGGSGSAIDALVSGGNIIDEASEDFQFQYGTNRSTPDARHPYYTDGYEAGGPSWYLSNYYMWLMFGEKQTEDPRLRYYFYRQDCDETDEDFFTLDCQAGPYPNHWPVGFPYCTASLEWGDPNDEYAGYWGRDHGNNDGIPPDDLKRTAWGLYPAGGKFDADDCSHVSNGGTDGGRGAGIQPIMLSSYVYFLRAEAAITMGTSDNAAQMLETAVRASISKVMGFESVAPVAAAFKPTQAQVDAYVTEVMNNFNGASSAEAKLNIVMKEYLLALQGNGIEGYNNYRRTCMPLNMQPVRITSPGAFPRSLWYPASYVNRNANANQKANVAGPVFWDTNPAGCLQ